MNPTTPWLEHYDHGVPATLAPYPDGSVLDWVADTAGRLPDHPAILFKGKTISYGALVLPNCPQFVIVELAVWKLGAILAPLNPLYTEPELETALGESGATIVV